MDARLLQRELAEPKAQISGAPTTCAKKGETRGYRVLGSWEMPVSEFHSEPLSCRVLHQWQRHNRETGGDCFWFPGSMCESQAPRLEHLFRPSGAGPAEPTWQSLDSLNQETRPGNSGSSGKANCSVFNPAGLPGSFAWVDLLARGPEPCWVSRLSRLSHPLGC